ncbi:MFS transporter, partial [Saccharomonospora saliphila]|uniref:MFS transporter n=1 Tax=Saccharomonospora saliphila TaxID=369829 RepID=UPI001E400503
MTPRTATPDEPDPAPAVPPSAPRQAGPARTRWAGVGALALAMLVVTSEMSLAGVVIPRIGADLDVAPAVTAWVLLAYALPMASVSIPAGRWIDGADPRAALLLSMTVVAVTSVLAALAPTIWLLLLARLMQGLAASLTLSGYMPLIALTVRPAQRGRAVSLVVTIMTVGGMAGASAGGLVAGELGWRAVLLLKLPLVAAVLWLARRAMPRTGRGLPRPGASTTVEAFLLGGGVAALLLAVENTAESPGLAAALA